MSDDATGTNGNNTSPPPPTKARLLIPDSLLSVESTEEAIVTYFTAGLKPIPIHAPTPDGGCSCGKVHDKTATGSSSSGKHPIQSNWQKKELSLDDLRDQIARLKFTPNVGMVLGKQRDGEYIIAVDVDDAPRFAELEAELGTLPETPRCDSGRGHRLFFTLPPEIDVDRIKNVTGLGSEPGKPRPGVDVKAEGGQVVVAPSLHANGKRYVWTRTGEIVSLPLQWAMELLKKPETPKWVQKYTPAQMNKPGHARARGERYLEVAVLGEARALAGCGSGMRNNTLFKSACRMFKLCAGLYLASKWHWIFEELLRAARAAGLPEHESRATLNSADRTVRESGDVISPMVLADPAPSKPPPSGEPSEPQPFESVPAPADDPWQLAPESQGKPIVQVNTKLKDNANDAIVALRADKNIYQRDGKLVFVTCVSREESEESPLVPTDNGVRHQLVEGSPQIREVTRPLLKGSLSDVAVFKKWIDSKQIWKTILPTDDIVSNVHDRTEWNGIRHIVGITESPMLRPDGSIVQETGYDAKTSWLYIPTDTFPVVHDKDATQQNACHYFKVLSEVFSDFPYASPAHRSVPIAAIMSLLARPAILGSIPAFLFDASTRGSGKTLHTDVIATIATGRYAPRMNYTSDELELEKILAGYALKGVPFFCLDNVPAMRPFGGGPLDRVLTARDTVDLRVLGSNNVPTLIWRAIVMATGNNMTLFGETARRVLMARLEPTEENPERRTKFRHDDLLAYVRAQRPRLVSAAMLIMRAYFRAGCPNMGCARWGSFEEWSRLIPNAIVFAGGEDPMKARPENDEEVDQESRAISVILTRVYAIIQGDPFRLTSLIDLLYKQPEGHEDPAGYGDIRDAIEVLAPRRGRMLPDATQLGRKLGAIARDRVIGGLRLVSRTGHGGAQRWQILAVVDGEGGSMQA